MRSEIVRWTAVIALTTGVAAAQIPSVPTDHYGPPTNCPERNGVTVHLANPQALATAKREQRLGKEMSWQGSTATLPSGEPMENLALARMKVNDYIDCVGEEGCYWADLDAQWKRASAALEDEAAKAKKGEKLAVVLDIDETSLSGYCEEKREDFGYVGPLFNDWIVSGEAAVGIPGALRFVARAEELHVAVFFITGRPGVPTYPVTPDETPDQTEATARNLKAAGFSGWTNLALRNGDERSMPTIDYKSGERKRIVDQGYRIAVSIGDQWSDLEGTPQADTSVKLPNPFYFLP